MVEACIQVGYQEWRVGVVKALLSAGATPCLTSLDYCLQTGSEEAVHLLLDVGGEPLKEEGRKRWAEGMWLEEEGESKKGAFTELFGVEWGSAL